MEVSLAGPLLAVCLSLSGGLPVGMPPLPEDRPLVSAAPEECLAYISWYGTAEADPDSKNRTERLMAEPELRQFIDAVAAAIQRAANAEKLPDGTAAGDAIVPVVRTALARPASLFVKRVSIGEGGVDVQAGLIVNAGEQQAEVQAAARKLEQILLEELGGTSQEITVAGTKFRELPVPPPAPAVMWGFHGSYLVVAVGEATAEQIITGLKEARGPPEWLAALHERLPVERPGFVAYVNTAGVLDAVSPLLGGAPMRNMLDTAGIGKVKFIGTVMGLDGENALGRTLVATDGEPSGIFNLLSDKPLEAGDLKHVPADATWAALARFDASAAYDKLFRLIGEINPVARDGILDELGEVEQDVGFRIQDDLLKPLGDTWSIYSAPSDGGLLVTGLTLVVDVRDRERLGQTLALATAQLASEHEVHQFEFQGHTVHYLETVPVAPAWCLTDKHLVISLFPQTVKAFLARQGPGDSLADLPAVKRALAEKPSKLLYEDTAAVFRLLYPVLQAAAPTLLAEMRKEGFDLDTAALPSARALLPHLGPSVFTVRRAEDGILIEGRQSLPGTGGLVGISPAGLAVLFPAVKSARVAAQRSVAMNSLRQFALAMHNYHDVHNAFPAPANYDANGNALLSWRVHVLPYLGHQALYEKFRLDEPWNSDHNEQLIKEMPPIFEAAGGKPVGDYKTCFLVPTGSSTIFPPGKGLEGRGLPIRSITDGTSNTLLLVEAAPERAVIWTKPDDWKFDPEKPKAGLVGHRENGFLAALADGSVRFISENIAKDALKALFTRNGGEVIRGF